ncbi:MAG: hypothetical protein A2653_03340 [Candidatus Zambryskibacteria bacterium RIFCSPHIGHO2_01_FULL_43_25]|uniref:Glycosyl transferase family 1 domain-containing protein n=1 Tax=Candidatus Zambryskibacteria bacterium RIFCSPLOWO2_01_FULL_45_21 TaxID=1802761 RepID=A0A1G2U1N7_9BACT|nr:MAG: hypothetical protein A2653_03340 [Candidatus Zambryskibacteria bacterium RIFCSPHIGHO2_01_FULL_43_25]OHB00170.1 MAG: hypothetical protein A3E94_01130 [Candidatus Zambryskibacteria bacterium RIFCSPHIGHO2_12_FULL_44_12b]OHB03435.1 MAG: hypothetical protein A3B14_02810 [Candidatus Zambryskibacteria bacterium RIFCSPLOWO2_01_FULL_45_21]
MTQDEKGDNLNIRVVSIGSDRELFVAGSSVSSRIREYAEQFSELHIIVFALSSLGLDTIKISQNCWVHPTNSSDKLSYISDALGIGKMILGRLFFGKSVVTSQDPFESGLVGWWLKKKFSVPLQLQIHTDLFNPYFYNSSWLNFFRVGLARFLLPRADGIRVVSKRIKGDILSRFKKILPEKILVLPIFVDIEKIKLSPVAVSLKFKYKQWERIVLMISRLMPEKNIPFALHVFKDVARKHPEFGMVIVGRGGEEFKLKRLVKNLGLDKNVVFEPWQQNVYSYYKTADLFFNTSIFEGYGMTIVEAAISGSPILTSDVGCARDLIKDGESGFICPVNDHVCFVRKMTNVLNNQSVSDLFRRNITESADNSLIPKNQYLFEYKNSIVSILEKNL